MTAQATRHRGRPGETQTTPARRTNAPGETQTTPASTNCCISSHSAQAGAGPVTSRGKQPQARVVPVTSRCKRPDIGAGPVKLRPPLHPAPAPPVKPRPPPHPQTAAFRAILPRQGRARLHDGANNLTQGWPGATQTTPVSTNCAILSHSAQAGAGPVTSRGKQPQARVVPVTSRCKRPDIGAGPVKLRPPLHPAPAPPVKPRPPPHPQTAAFRAILPRQGRARLHDGANNLTQGWPGATQTTPVSTNCAILSHSAQAGAGPVTPRGKQPQAGVGPVKPRPPRHAQNAAFRAIPPRQGRSQLHHGANSLREGWAR